MYQETTQLRNNLKKAAQNWEQQLEISTQSTSKKVQDLKYLNAKCQEYSKSLTVIKVCDKKFFIFCLKNLHSAKNRKKRLQILYQSFQTCKTKRATQIYRNYVGF